MTEMELAVMTSTVDGLTRDSVLGQLAQRISSKTARVGIVGLGYVGLPLAVEFAKTGFLVTGIELDDRRIDGVSQGCSYIPDVPSDDLRVLVRHQRLSATKDAAELANLDVAIICVPTPLRKSREPDITAIISAAADIGRFLHRGQLIILESTTYPGTTDEVILPMLEQRGLQVGQEFCLAFSPERIDPGNSMYTTHTIPKVIGGITPTCQWLARLLYGQIMERVVPVSSTKVAEMVKLLENTFRAVNIGLVNEIAMMCHTLGLDVWEVIDAAKTKPFGFMAFYPGPGIGGHCIPKDPMYLAWKARVHGFDPRFIELADRVNREMPRYVVDKIAHALNDRRKPVKDAAILLVGLAYKQDVNDTRDSPAFEVAHALSMVGACLQYHDPHIPQAVVNGMALSSVPLSAERLHETDCVVILTNHSNVDYELILREASLIVDTRNHYGRVQRAPGQVVRL